jgi:hypothetical protein
LFLVLFQLIFESALVAIFHHNIKIIFGGKTVKTIYKIWVELELSKYSYFTHYGLLVLLSFHLDLFYRFGGVASWIVKTKENRSILPLSNGVVQRN